MFCAETLWQVEREASLFPNKIEENKYTQAEYLIGDLACIISQDMQNIIPDTKQYTCECHNYVPIRNHWLYVLKGHAIYNVLHQAYNE